MAKIDYDGGVALDYDRGRAYGADVSSWWIDTFARHLPARRPLDGLDLGSGTGRFTPHLAHAFGRVLGIEPSVSMREIADREAAHPRVRYLPGSAESIPVEDESMDYCLLFLAWHHVEEPQAAAREIARVLRPGGVLLCRTPLADQMPDLWWLHHFPSGASTDAAMYRTRDEEIATFTQAGLESGPGVVWVDEPSIASRRQRLEQLQTRTLSVLCRLSDDDFATGITSLEGEVALDPDAPAPGQAASLLVMQKPRHEDTMSR